jgi:hypothetical protein
VGIVVFIFVVLILVVFMGIVVLSGKVELIFVTTFVVFTLFATLLI